MITTVTGCPETVELALYLNENGELSLETLKDESAVEAIDLTFFSLTELVEEFVSYSRHPETNRIETKQADPCFYLLEELKRSLRILEDALYDDKFPQ